MRYVVTFLLSVGLAMAQWGITPNPGQPIPKAPLPGSISTGQCLYNNNGVWGGTACAGGSGAPTVGTYIIQTTNASLPDAQVLASLATGIVKNTTTTGVLSIAAAGTDYQAPISATAPITVVSNVVACNVASGSQPGCLASADWTTFNGKQAAGSYITALTGDATASGPGSAAITLATVNSNVGSFTCSSVTANAKGLITAISTGSCGGGGGAFQANGTPLTSTSTINFENSAATDGITLTFANPSAGNVQLGFTGTLSLAGGGTGATSQANAAIAVLPTATRAGDVIYWDGSIWNHLAGNNSGTNFLQETSSGVPSWTASTASTVWQLAGSTVVTGNTFNANFGLTLTNVGGVATTGVNTAVIPSHALLQAGGDVYCAPSGGITTYICNLGVALTAYTKGMTIVFVPDVSTTTSATLTINNIMPGPSIKQIDGTTDPGANLVAGQPYWLEYDGVVFRMMGAVGGGSMVYPSGTGFAIVTGGASWGTTLADPLPVGHGGTGAATAANALIALFPAATRAGDIIYCATYSSGCTSWGLLAGNNSGTNFLQENSAGAPSWNAGSSTVSLSAITAASGANSINNVDNQQTWYWAKTSNNSKGLFISENTAATGGTFTNQELVQISTIAGSTAIPLGVSNSLTGTQALPTASFAAAWNTSGQAIGLTFNATITGSCTTCLLESLAVGGVRQWTTDVSGNVIQLGNLTMGTDGTTAATVQMANGSAAFHTILGSAATANNTVKFFATAPVTGDLVSCVTSSTTCTFTDSGVLAANVVAVSASGAGTIAYYNGSAWTTLAGNASGTKVLQETSSGVPSWASAAGGGTGNAGNEVSVSFSATPTYTCGSATAGTVTIFEVGILTGNITGSTLATCGAAQLIAFQFQQASSGGPYTVTMPSGFDALTISPTASIYTTALYWYDGTTGRLQSVSTTDTPGFIFMPERSAPGTPPSGDCAIWSDSTDHTGPEAKCNNSANIFTLVPRNTGTANQVLLSSATGGSYSWGAVSLTAAVSGILPSANGGTGVNNTATLTLGSSNQNWATIGTGIVKVTTTTGAITDAASADVTALWSGSCSSSTFLRGDGACASTGGGFTAPASLSNSYLSSTYTAGTGGTTAGLLVKLDTSNPSLVIAAATSDANLAGFAVSTVSATASVEVATTGQFTAIADNTITAGDYLQSGTSTAGRVRDTGTTNARGIAQTVQIVGRALAGATVGQNVLIQLPDAWPMWGMNIGGTTGIVTLASGGTGASLTASNGGIFYSGSSVGAILAGTATASFPLLSGSTAAPTWATVTYLTSGTSGGIPYLSSATALSSSGALTQYGVVFGGGAGGAPTSSAQGGSNFPLIGQGAANPIFSTISYPASLTSGGILYGSSTTALASSALLVANVPVFGGGAGTAPATGLALGSGTGTAGHLACATASNTQGNCTGTPSNNFIGVFTSTTSYTPTGIVTVTLDATVNVTNGDIVCASSSAGLSHDNGTASCASGEGVGTVTTTASSVSSATVSLRLQ